MELIRINDKKVKIMLTPSDMKIYELDVQQLSGGSEESRRAFRHMLHDAGVGSETVSDTDKIYVQYYPSKEGGCEMFITKLDVAKEGTAVKENHLHATADKAGSQRLLAYRFATLAHLLLGCRYLCALPEMARSGIVSEAYSDDSDTFYLLVRMSRPEESSKYLSYLLGEVGVPFSPAVSARAYIVEHGRPLCSHRAIETLGKL